MAASSSLKSKLILIAKALKEFATEQGWKAGEYKILFRVNRRWAVISVYFIAKDFGKLSNQEMWEMVLRHVEKSLATVPDIGYAIRLAVRDWKQVEEGGIYSIPPGFVDQEELLTVP